MLGYTHNNQSNMEQLKEKVEKLFKSFQTLRQGKERKSKLLNEKVKVLIEDISSLYSELLKNPDLKNKLFINDADVLKAFLKSYYDEHPATKLDSFETILRLVFQILFQFLEALKESDALKIRLSTLMNSVQDTESAIQKNEKEKE